MKRIQWRLAAASGVVLALALGAGPAAASSSGGFHRPGPSTVQFADQAASTEQHAESSAESKQFLPINANVPVQILSNGSNGGDTEQSNNSTAKSAAVNQAETKQSVEQDQEAKWKGHDRKGHDDHDGYSHKGHDDRKGHDDHDGYSHKGHDDRKGHDDHDGYGHKGHDDRKGHSPKGHTFQGAEQSASTDQDATSSATSKQILPVNVNVPLQVLSFGKNGGDTEQSNNSTAKSAATNQAWTKQSVDQDQEAGWDHGSKGRDGKGSAFQGAEQSASTDQDATSSATSKQIAPVNINAPIQILSFGSNGGDTEQSNNSTARSAAVNEAGTQQSVDQDQQSGSGSAFQGAGQSASTDQDATSTAKSEQIAPVNVNAPIQVLSFGSNGGDTEQSNNSTAQSVAANQAGTSQAIGQSQSVLGGLTG